MPVGVLISPDGSLAYVANASVNTVSAIDTASNTVIASVPAGDQPQLFAITPDGANLYVSNCLGGTLSVIDTATNSIAATIPVGADPQGLVIAACSRLAGRTPTR